MKESVKPANGQTSTSRRKAVKKIVGGVAALAAYEMLPVNWEKPIIEQVFLPAHAQTSACPDCGFEDPCTITVLSGDETTAEVIVRVDGFVTQPIAGLAVTIRVTPFAASGQSLSDTATYQTVTDAQGMFTGTYTVAGGPGIDAVSAITTVALASGSAGCDVTTRVSQPGGGGPAPDPAVEYFDPALSLWGGFTVSWIAIRVTGTSGTFVRINELVSRRWAGSFNAVPETINLTNTDSGPGCNPNVSGSVTINSVTPAEVSITLVDRVGISTTVTVPAAPIPAEPAITNACGGNRPPP